MQEQRNTDTSRRIEIRVWWAKVITGGQEWVLEFAFRFATGVCAVVLVRILRVLVLNPAIGTVILKLKLSWKLL